MLVHMTSENDRARLWRAVPASRNTAQASRPGISRASTAISGTVLEQSIASTPIGGFAQYHSIAPSHTTSSLADKVMNHPKITRIGIFLPGMDITNSSHGLPPD